MKVKYLCLLYFISLVLSKTNLSSLSLPLKLNGKLVFHRYTSYETEDSQMFIYDFKTDTLENISKDWTSLHHGMNGHFSPDGKLIVFMGIGQLTGSWDIFLYDLEKKGEPENLTPDGDYRDEDPKFSYSGKKLLLKEMIGLQKLI